MYQYAKYEDYPAVSYTHQSTYSQTASTEETQQGDNTFAKVVWYADDGGFDKVDNPSPFYGGNTGSSYSYYTTEGGSTTTFSTQKGGGWTEVTSYTAQTLGEISKNKTVPTVFKAFSKFDKSNFTQQSTTCSAENFTSKWGKYAWNKQISSSSSKGSSSTKYTFGSTGGQMLSTENKCSDMGWVGGYQPDCLDLNPMNRVGATLVGMTPETHSRGGWGSWDEAEDPPVYHSTKVWETKTDTNDEDYKDEHGAYPTYTVGSTNWESTMTSTDSDSYGGDLPTGTTVVYTGVGNATIKPMGWQYDTDISEWVFTTQKTWGPHTTTETGKKYITTILTSEGEGDAEDTTYVSQATTDECEVTTTTMSEWSEGDDHWSYTTSRGLRSAISDISDIRAKVNERHFETESADYSNNPPLGGLMPSESVAEEFSFVVGKTSTDETLFDDWSDGVDNTVSSYSIPQVESAYETYEKTKDQMETVSGETIRSTTANYDKPYMEEVAWSEDANGEQVASSWDTEFVTDSTQAESGRTTEVHIERPDWWDGKSEDSTGDRRFVSYKHGKPDGLEQWNYYQAPWGRVYTITQAYLEWTTETAVGNKLLPISIIQNHKTSMSKHIPASYETLAEGWDYHQATDETYDSNAWDIYFHHTTTDNDASVQVRVIPDTETTKVYLGNAYSVETSLSQEYGDRKRGPDGEWVKTVVSFTSSSSDTVKEYITYEITDTPANNCTDDDAFRNDITMDNLDVTYEYEEYTSTLTCDPGDSLCSGSDTPERLTYESWDYYTVTDTIDYLGVTFSVPAGGGTDDTTEDITSTVTCTTTSTWNTTTQLIWEGGLKKSRYITDHANPTSFTDGSNWAIIHGSMEDEDTASPDWVTLNPYDVGDHEVRTASVRATSETWGFDERSYWAGTDSYSQGITGNGTPDYPRNTYFTSRKKAWEGGASTNIFPLRHYPFGKGRYHPNVGHYDAGAFAVSHATASTYWDNQYQKPYFTHEDFSKGYIGTAVPHDISWQHGDNKNRANQGFTAPRFSVVSNEWYHLSDYTFAGFQTDNVWDIGIRLELKDHARELTRGRGGNASDCYFGGYDYYPLDERLGVIAPVLLTSGAKYSMSDIDYMDMADYEWKTEDVVVDSAWIDRYSNVKKRTVSDTSALTLIAKMTTGSFFTYRGEGTDDPDYGKPYIKRKWRVGGQANAFSYTSDDYGEEVTWYSSEYTGEQSEMSTDELEQSFVVNPADNTTKHYTSGIDGTHGLTGMKAWGGQDMDGKTRDALTWILAPIPQGAVSNFFMDNVHPDMLGYSIGNWQDYGDRGSSSPAGNITVSYTTFGSTDMVGNSHASDTGTFGLNAYTPTPTKETTLSSDIFPHLAYSVNNPAYFNPYKTSNGHYTLPTSAGFEGIGMHTHTTTT